jgi:hypothetical protein
MSADEFSDRIERGEVVDPSEKKTRPVDPDQTLLPESMGIGWDDEDEEDTPPCYGPVGGGDDLFFDGMTHNISGAGGSGKTFFVIWTLLMAVRVNPEKRVVFVDYEDSRRSFKKRLKRFGCTKAEADRIDYFHTALDLRQGTPSGDLFLLWVEEIRPAIVAIDSVAHSCAAADLDDEKNKDYNKWHLAVCNPLDDLEVCTILVDHTGHDDGPGGPAKRAKGASAKSQRPSGVVYLFQTTKPFSKKQSGEALIKVVRSRPAFHTKGEIAAKLTIDVQQSGKRLAFSMVMPASISKTADGTPRLTGLMQKLSRLLRDEAEPLSKTALADLAGGKVDTALSQIRILVDEGYFSQTKGAKGAHMLASVRDYEQADDPESDNYRPI